MLMDKLADNFWLAAAPFNVQFHGAGGMLLVLHHFLLVNWLIDWNPKAPRDPNLALPMIQGLWEVNQSQASHWFFCLGWIGNILMRTQDYCSHNDRWYKRRLHSPTPIPLYIILCSFTSCSVQPSLSFFPRFLFFFTSVSEHFVSCWGFLISLFVWPCDKQ